MKLETQAKKAGEKEVVGERSGVRTADALKIGSKKELREYVSDIEKRVVDKDGADLAALVAINQILRMPNVGELIDAEIKGQIKDLWIKLKASGVSVEDPPMLFGLPENFNESDLEDANDEEFDAAPPVRSTPAVSKKDAPKPATDPGEDLPH